MEIELLSSSGSSAGRMSLSDRVFAAPFNEPLVHEVVVAYLAGARAGTKAQKTRGEVSGGNSKPWRQKGTGRARAGTTRGPLWRHGGRAFAAKPRCFAPKVNRKAYRQAMRAILSELLRQNRLLAVDALTLESHKTKLLASRLEDMKVGEALILTAQPDRDLYLAARNLPRVKVLQAKEVDPVSLVGFDKVIATRGALEQLQAWLA